MGAGATGCTVPVAVSLNLQIDVGRFGPLVVTLHLDCTCFEHLHLDQNAPGTPDFR